jgi:hypothetical protein
MSLWTRNNKPKWAPNAVAGKNGWYHPITNEPLAVFGTKPVIVTTPSVQSVILYKNTLAASGDAMPDTRTSLKTGDYLYFAVRFNGQVTVVPDPTVPSPYLTVTIGISNIIFCLSYHFFRFCCSNWCINRYITFKWSYL